jgi:hypothetical protein
MEMILIASGGTRGRTGSKPPVQLTPMRMIGPHYAAFLNATRRRPLRIRDMATAGQQTIVDIFDAEAGEATPEFAISAV